jgi:ParB family chromosome partitioning protein
MKHKIKLSDELFNDVVDGTKTFELRDNDRGYSVGDTLVLMEWNPRAYQYTGRSVKKKVSYILKDYIGLERGYVIMSITD